VASLLLLAARGGGPLAWPLLALLLPVFVRWLGAWPIPAMGAPGNSGPVGGGSKHNGVSTVETRFLRMSLNHQTGEMHGEVLQGRFADRALVDLSFEELVELSRECRSDPQSVAVLEAYLDRNFPDWRNSDAGSSCDSGNEASDVSITIAEAYRILGLEPGASPEQIKSAHRRLMQRLHPDHGGSTYLASRVNGAKDLLLRSRG
jgi:DnaJ-domain-containing protein 1